MQASSKPSGRLSRATLPANPVRPECCKCCCFSFSFLGAPGGKSKRVREKSGKAGGKNGLSAVESRAQSHADRGLRKSPLYSNCVMLDPEGEFLCTADNRKARWYLTRNLAKVVKEQPFTIQLNFVPAGKGNAGSAFYMEEKQNICACSLIAACWYRS